MKISGFGSSSNRFQSSGMYPGLIPSRSMNPNVGPGKYNVEKGFDYIEKHKPTFDWRRCLYVEKRKKLTLKLLYNQNKKKNKGRPQFYRGQETEAPFQNYHKGSLQNRAPRFVLEQKFVNPPPGTYGLDGVPDKLMNIMDKKRRESNAMPLLQRGGKHDRCRQPSTLLLGPGSYPISSDPLSVLNKQAGNRGPYDVFSLNRRDPIPTGHFARKPPHNLGPGSFDVQTNYFAHRKIIGKFPQAIRFSKKPHERIFHLEPGNIVDDENQVCPASYTPHHPAHEKDHFEFSKGAFWTSAKRYDKAFVRKLFGNNFDNPEVSRYNVEKSFKDSHIYEHEITAPFKSTKEKALSGKECDFIRERNRPKNIEHLKKPVNHFSTEEETKFDPKDFPTVQPMKLQ